ncbi:hypothetical protein E2562_035050 [Oryza meyeriana var. granulata]|uniref:Uncharacterized protein n=1 Tax=Oryza meyeriana var. granulata TaxID=110450 RepID=A0A6G1CKV1_9ORYZ|nr:hypothetical protein E2562_035050 [Oryza meyeriana var. granulata]
MALPSSGGTDSLEPVIVPILQRVDLRQSTSIYKETLQQIKVRNCALISTGGRPKDDLELQSQRAMDRW